MEGWTKQPPYSSAVQEPGNSTRAMLLRLELTGSGDKERCFQAVQLRTSTSSLSGKPQLFPTWSKFDNERHAACSQQPRTSTCLRGRKAEPKNAQDARHALAATLVLPSPNFSCSNFHAILRPQFADFFFILFSSSRGGDLQSDILVLKRAWKAQKFPHRDPKSAGDRHHPITTRKFGLPLA